MQRRASIIFRNSSKEVDQRNLHGYCVQFLSLRIWLKIKQTLTNTKNQRLCPFAHKMRTETQLKRNAKRTQTQRKMDANATQNGRKRNANVVCVQRKRNGNFSLTATVSGLSKSSTCATPSLPPELHLDHLLWQPAHQFIEGHTIHQSVYICVMYMYIEMK